MAKLLLPSCVVVAGKCSDLWYGCLLALTMQMVDRNLILIIGLDFSP